MSYKPISLVNLIYAKNRILYLPHIQRPFVWEWEQVVRLMDSLIKNYPIQTLLFWKTREAIKARRFMDDIVEAPDLSDYYEANISEQGREKTFVLDGQQRLQSLFTVFDGTFSGKAVYLNLLSGHEEIENGIFYEFITSANGVELPYLKLKNLTVDTRNALDIAEELNDKLALILPNESNEARRAREKHVRRTVGQLISILREDQFFWVEELDGISSDSFPYKEVLNIFIRVNSGGTRLDSADLMFAAMKEAWAEVEENIEAVVDNLNNSGRLSFDKSFVLKCLMLVSGKGAVLAPKLFVGVEGETNLQHLEKNWPSAHHAFDQLRDFITTELKIYSDKVIRSYNSFIPIFEYFFLHPAPSPEERALLKSYYYRSQLFNWYSARTDQLLNTVHNLIFRSQSGFPIQDIKNYFQSQKKNVDLKIEDLQDIRLRFIVLNLVYVEVMGHSPFDVAYRGNEPHIDHIYPKHHLTTLGYSTTQINHIGNYRYVGAMDNIRKRGEAPDLYFSRLKQSGVDIMRHLLVEEAAQYPERLTDETYKAFRDKRLEKLYDICSRVVNR